MFEGIQFWSASLDAITPDEYAALQKALNESEIVRARRFYFERDRRRFTAARGLLRTLLASYLQAAPASLEFAYTLRGKPCLSAPATDLRFNLSHSGGTAMFAFTRNREVGIDVEAGERLGDDWPAIARRYFSERERAELFALPEQGRRPAFLTGWARKEAYLKAAGLGISDGLQGIEVTLGPGRAAAFLSTEIASGWTFCDLPPFAAAAPALASALVVARNAAEEAGPPVERLPVASVADLLAQAQSGGAMRS